MTVPRLPDDDAIDVWICPVADLGRLRYDDTPWRSLIVAQDLLDVDRLRRPAERRRLLVRRAITRIIVGTALGTSPNDLVLDRHCARCGSTSHGKPRVTNAALAFSVSSCDDVVVVALAAHEIGVDVERHMGQPPAPGALGTFEMAELRAMASEWRARCFLDLWTAKEAVLKADGAGLAGDPSLVDASSLLTTDRGSVTFQSREWYVHRIAPDQKAAGDLSLSVAGSSTRLPRLHLFEINLDGGAASVTRGH
jgi:phosphopantetheinyl transferase